MTKIAIEVETILEWTAFPSASCKRWIAECKALSLCIEGDTLDEVHSLIPEACFALFSDLLKDNEFDEFLRQRGWRAVDMPDDPSATEPEFAIPWHLVAKGTNNGSERRVH